MKQKATGTSNLTAELMGKFSGYLQGGFWGPVGQTAAGRVRDVLTQLLFHPEKLFVRINISE